MEYVTSEQNRNKWDMRFMELARHVGCWSKDPSTQVGCVITDSDNRIISTGYNGLPKNIDDLEARLVVKDVKYRLTVHAELNAILFARTNLVGMTLYVTHPPCASCAAVIAQMGLGRVVHTIPTSDFMDRWGGSYAEARSVFTEADIAVKEWVGL